MDGTRLAVYVMAVVLITLLARVRSVFPYLLVFVLGLEYFSPGAPDSVFTIPKMGFAGIVLSQLGTGRFRLVLTRKGVFLPLAALSGYLALTVLWSIDPTRSMMRAVSLALLMVLFLVVQGFIRSPRDLRGFWRAFVLYALANAAMTVYQVLSGVTNYVEDAGLRAGGLGVNPSEGAFYTGIGILILATHFGSREVVSGWLRGSAVQVVAFGALCVGLLATGSRGGIASVVVASAGLVLLTQRGRLRAFVRYGVLVAAIGIVVVAVPQVSELVATRITASSEDQLGNRLVIWAQLWQSVREHPIIGNGLSSTAIATSAFRETSSYSPHNVPLGVLLDGGAVGLMLFGVLVVRLIGLAGSLRRDPSAEFGLNGLILTVLLVQSAVFMLSHDITYNKLFWLVLGLVEAARLTRNDHREPAPRRGRRLRPVVAGPAHEVG